MSGTDSGAAFDSGSQNLSGPPLRMLPPRLDRVALVAGAASILVGLGLLLAAAPGASAAPADPPPGQPTDRPAGIESSLQTPGDEDCLSCHSNHELSRRLDNGDILQLYVDGREHAKSVHGQTGIACIQCHTDIKGFPHPEFAAADRRDASLKLYTLCQTCHEAEYERANDSVHSRALAAGNREAAICTDCHTAHAVRRLVNPAGRQTLPDARLWIPQTCARCHSAIYDKYQDSVHGAALIDESNLDVPTCIDCHGVHNIPDPTTAEFILKSPNICARCHTDSQIMDKYGISTQVLNTYVADFHGTTVTLFEKQSPDAETNKPVCFDCHGVHDIRRTDDPQKGLQVRENLLARCQQCHPGATTSFSAAWLSHYIPSQDKYPLVYFVNAFYQLFIPGVLGGMAIIVALDISWRVRTRLRRPRPAALPTPMLDASIDFDKVESSQPPSDAPSAPPGDRPERPGPGEESERG